MCGSETGKRQEIGSIKKRRGVKPLDSLGEACPRLKYTKNAIFRFLRSKTVVSFILKAKKDYPGLYDLYQRVLIYARPKVTSRTIKRSLNKTSNIPHINLVSSRQKEFSFVSEEKLDEKSCMLTGLLVDQELEEVGSGIHQIQESVVGKEYGI